MKGSDSRVSGILKGVVGLHPICFVVAINTVV